MNFSFTSGSLSDLKIPKIKISIRVIAVVIALIGLYFFFHMTNTIIPEIDAKTSKLENEISSLKVTESNLSRLYNDMTFYLDETERLYKETEEILNEFPTFMYLEDKILYADTLLKTDLNGYNINKFTYGDSTYVMNAAFGVDNASTMELYSVGLHAGYSNLTYTQIKELLNYGLNSPQRFVMSSLNVSYSENTGYLSGEFSFSTYFIFGQSTPYEFPPDVIEGLGNSDRIDDLFGARKNPFTGDEVDD